VALSGEILRVLINPSRVMVPVNAEFTVKVMVCALKYCATVDQRRYVSRYLKIPIVHFKDNVNSFVFHNAGIRVCGNCTLTVHLR